MQPLQLVLHKNTLNLEEYVLKTLIITPKKMLFKKHRLHFLPTFNTLFFLTFHSFIFFQGLNIWETYYGL